MGQYDEIIHLSGVRPDWNGFLQGILLYIVIPVVITLANATRHFSPFQAFLFTAFLMVLVLVGIAKIFLSWVLEPRSEVLSFERKTLNLRLHRFAFGIPVYFQSVSLRAIKCLNITYEKGRCCERRCELNPGSSGLPVRIVPFWGDDAPPEEHRIWAESLLGYLYSSYLLDSIPQEKIFHYLDNCEECPFDYYPDLTSIA